MEKFHLDRQNKCLTEIQKPQPIQIGQYVLIWLPKIDNGKLSRCWYGPLKVIKHYSRTSYLCKDPITGTVYKRSTRHLRPLGRHISNHFQQKYFELEQNSELPDKEANPETNKTHLDIRETPINADADEGTIFSNLFS